MKKFATLSLCAALLPYAAFAQKPPDSADAQKPPLLSSTIVAALDQELSGEAAKRNLEGITREHRVRGSRGFRAAAELVLERAKAYGLSDAQILEFPADGKTFYGTQKSRLAWDADFAELWELRPQGNAWMPAVRIASWEAMPVSLAEDSESGDVTADLVDVGDGIRESDYTGKDVRGKLVLVGAQPGGVQHLAIGVHGVAGIVSYAQNQRSAWWGEDENLVRWGHLESFGGDKTFAFMVSLKTARAFRDRLARGGQIHMHAVVKAGQHPGVLSVVTATIPGADPKLRGEEIAYSCHLDHQRPGANDNASGCVAILEVARTLQKLINEGKVARPARTLRFIWPPEIEGTTTLLNAMPEFAQRIKAMMHMDMVGGGPVTKATFHVTRGPASLPSFVYDIGAAFGEFVNKESEQYAGTGEALYPFVDPEGGKEPLHAQMVEYSMGSDHDVYEEGAFRIPAIYMNDEPDRYIHTNGDVAANIDPTKLKRAAFIGAASGYFLANMSSAETTEVMHIIERASLGRLATTLARGEGLTHRESEALRGLQESYETGTFESISRFARVEESTRAEYLRFAGARESLAFPHGVGDSDGIEVPDEHYVFERVGAAKGPMAVFGYDYLADHYGADRTAKLALLGYQGLRGAGSEYAYEVLNFVDGKRSIAQIRDAVSAEYGPVPLEMVREYLTALESVGVIRRTP
ncbi:MAG TPA: M28 family peptidase [Candidatus Acidoferrales bacterium]|nr:M28 family peptidase [Candidatus Acidoferrales bacterium]